MKIKGKWILGIIVFALIGSCEKPEGIGGESLIFGNVMINTYDKEFRVLQESYPADDENVFIIYGDNSTVSDETNTSYNGAFEFKNLSKGNYTIFVYSEDPSGNNVHDIIVDTTIELSSNKSTVNLKDITIYKTLDYDDGNASIRGVVRQVNWSKDFIYVMDTTNAQETDVYLVYENDDMYIERTRTLDDGSFAFTGLLKGNYKIITYADDFYGRTEKVAKTKTAEINLINADINVGNIYIDIED